MDDVTQPHESGVWHNASDIERITELEAELEQYRGVAMTAGAEQAMADYRRLEQDLTEMTDLYHSNMRCECGDDEPASM